MDRDRRRMPPPSQFPIRRTRPEPSTTPEQQPVVAPKILAKPQRVLDEDDADWPSISGAASVHSRTQSPAKTSTATQEETERQATTVPGMVQIRAGIKPGTPELGRKRTPASDSTRATKVLSGGLKLVSENMEWCDQILEHLNTESSEFTVIGALGPQGTGKSTLLSMIGGNDPFDMYRQYIFRPASREAVETCRHQTAGIQIYPTKSRIILIDCQPLMSASVLEEMLRLDKRYNFEYKTVENFTEIESLQLASFVLQVCHTVLVNVDWFLDLNLARFLQTAEMLKPNVALQSETTTQFADRYPNIVFVHQRAKNEDFHVAAYRDRCALLEKMFRTSHMNLRNGVSMAHTRQCEFQGEIAEDLADVGYYLLPDMKLRGQKPTGEAISCPPAGSSFRSVADYEKLIEDLRLLVRNLPKAPYTVPPAVPLNEKTWFHYCSKVWESIRKSHLISEYGRTMP